jgi:hypothetical protein
MTHVHAKTKEAHMDSGVNPNHSLDFMVHPGDLRTRQFASGESPEDMRLESDQILLKIDKFGLSANNITYALLGESYDYWKYYPAADGWARIPVWGYADVVRTDCAGFSKGERFWGLYPMASHVVLRLGQTTADGFIDGTSHRQGLRPFYNGYTRKAEGPAGERQDNLQILLRPLVMTALMLEDFLSDSGFFGAEAVLISSASSKLSLALADLLSRAANRPLKIIGLTSAAHVDFVRRVGSYDEVISYDDIAALPPKLTVAYVDVAGDRAARQAVYSRFGANVRYSAMVGFSHWDGGGEDQAAAPVKHTPFFVLDRVATRAPQWGPEGIRRRFLEAWGPVSERIGAWMEVVHGHGAQDLERRYDDLLAGRLDPRRGYVFSL